MGPPETSAQSVLVKWLEWCLEAVVEVEASNRRFVNVCSHLKRCHLKSDVSKKTSIQFSRQLHRSWCLPKCMLDAYESFVQC